MKKNRRIDQLEACIETLKTKHGSFTLELSFQDAVILIAQLRPTLTSRDDYPFDVTRSIIDDMIATMESSVPDIGPLLRADDTGETT